MKLSPSTVMRVPPPDPHWKPAFASLLESGELAQRVTMGF